MEKNSGEKCCPTCHTHKCRQEDEKQTLLNRLRRIEGQVRGVKAMVDSDAYCIDILTQISAIESALGAFAKELLSRHIKECVVDDIRAGKYETVDELVKTVSELMR